MLIKTKIIFTDEHESELLGKDVSYADELIFDLSDVSGLMPGNDSGSRTIIFLGGRDLLITKPYKEMVDAWTSTKSMKNERIN